MRWSFKSTSWTTFWDFWFTFGKAPECGYDCDIFDEYDDDDDFFEALEEIADYSAFLTPERIVTDEMKELTKKAKEAVKAALDDANSHRREIVTRYLQNHRIDLPKDTPSSLSLKEMADLLRLRRFTRVTDEDTGKMAIILCLSFIVQMPDDILNVFFDENGEILFMTIDF